MLRVISDAVTHQYRAPDGRVFDTLEEAEVHYAAAIILTIITDGGKPSKQQKIFADRVAQQAARLMPILQHLVEAEHDETSRSDTDNEQ